MKKYIYSFMIAVALMVTASTPAMALEPMASYNDRGYNVADAKKLATSDSPKGKAFASALLAITGEKDVNSLFEHVTLEEVSLPLEGQEDYHNSGWDGKQKKIVPVSSSVVWKGFVGVYTSPTGEKQLLFKGNCLNILGDMLPKTRPVAPPAQTTPPAQVAPPNSFNAKVATELAEIEARLQEQPQQAQPQQPQPPAPVNVTQLVNSGGSGEAVPMSCGLLQDIFLGCPVVGVPLVGYNVVHFGGRPFYGGRQAVEQVNVVSNVNVSSNSSSSVNQQPQPRQPHPTPNPPKSGGGTLPPTGGLGGGTNPPTGGSGGGTTGPTGGGTRPTPQFHQAPASPHQGGMSNGGFSTVGRGSYSGGGGRGGGHR